LAVYGAPLIAVLISAAFAFQGARMRALGARMMRWTDLRLIPRLPQLRRA
jgi:hypothetical protein